MIRLTTFGSLEIRESDGTEFPSLAAHPKPAALLVYLAVAHPNGWHRRDTLTSIFWPEQDSAHARASLRQALYFLRQELGHEAIMTRGDVDVRLQEGICASEVAAFHTAIEQKDCTAAAELYAGPFLDGFHLSGAPEFERWVDTERDRFSRVYAEAVEHMARQAENPADAVACWHRLADHDPHSGRVALELMKALEAVGNRAAALHVASKHATALDMDLGATPDPDVEAFAHQLRDGSPPHGATAPEHHPDAPSTQGVPTVLTGQRGWVLRAIVVLAVAAVVVSIILSLPFR